MRHFHADKIRKYIAPINRVRVIRDRDADFGPVKCPRTDTTTERMNSNLTSEQIDKCALSHLGETEIQQLLSLLDEFADCFIEKPGLCTYVQHKINISPDLILRQFRAYEVPHILQLEAEKQVTELLEIYQNLVTQA